MGRVIYVQQSVVEEGECQVHREQAYTYDHLVDALNNNTSMDILIKNDDVDLHIVLAVAVGGDTIVEFYEGVVTSVNGINLPIFNINRTVNDQSSAQIFHTPTITNNGTRLKRVFFTGGSGGNSSRSVGAGPARPGTEVISKKNTDYLVKITNVAGQAKRIGFDCSFYHREH